MVQIVFLYYVYDTWRDEPAYSQAKFCFRALLSYTAPYFSRRDHTYHAFIISNYVRLILGKVRMLADLF